MKECDQSPALASNSDVFCAFGRVCRQLCLHLPQQCEVAVGSGQNDYRYADSGHRRCQSEGMPKTLFASVKKMFKKPISFSRASVAVLTTDCAHGEWHGRYACNCKRLVESTAEPRQYSCAHTSARALATAAATVDSGSSDYLWLCHSRRLRGATRVALHRRKRLVERDHAALPVLRLRADSELQVRMGSGTAALVCLWCSLTRSRA